MLLNTGLLFSCRPFSSLLFYRATACNATHGIAVAILSVRPSVTCLDCDKTIWCTADILIPHERAITLVFWHEQWLVGDVPFHLKFALKVTHPFEKRRLQQISTYHDSTVRDSENVQLWRIGSRPRVLQRAMYGVRTLLLSHQRVAQKVRFIKNKHKCDFNRINQRQCCSIAIPPSNSQ